MEGDFYLKVMGNMHFEVGGAWNTHVSQGPQSESSGDSQNPADTTDGASQTSQADTAVTSGQVGADIVEQARTGQVSDSGQAQVTAAETSEMYTSDQKRREELRLKKLY